MFLKQEFDNAKKQMDGKTFQEKASYFWYYYKWHTIILLLLIVAAINIIYTNLTSKECVLNGAFLNTSYAYADTSNLEKGFLEQNNLDTQKYEIILDTSLGYSTATQTVDSASYETVQVLMAKVAAEELDFLLDMGSFIYDLAYKQYFVDLTTVLSENQLQKYESYLLYIDSACFDDSYSDIETEYPDATKPELMESPIPVLINVSNIDKLTDIYPSDSTTLLLGVIANGPNAEMAIKFIDYLFQ